VKILRQWVLAMDRLETVVHNGVFDLLILAWKYKLAIGPSIFDTMYAHHRCWPEVEKSLGHAMSHLTWMPYHKDEGLYSPRSQQEDIRLWTYNAKDVEGTLRVKHALLKHMEGDPGLQASVAESNALMRPCLINTLTGFAFDQAVREQTMSDNDARMTMYLKAIRYLIGEDNYKTCGGKSDKALPLSNSQMTRYFHDMLGYPVMRRSEKTGKPGLGGTEIYKLKLKYPQNAVLDMVLAYRNLSTESGYLKFELLPEH